MNVRPDGNTAANAFGPGRWLGRTLGRLAAFNLFGMMVLTLADVIGRYVFNAPVPGAFEITEMMMGVLVFAILPVVSATDDQIAIGLFDRAFAGRARRVKETVVALIGAGFVAFVCWRVWHEAEQHAAYRDETAFLGIPVAPLVYFMAAATALTLVALLAVAWDRASGRGSRGDTTGGAT